MYMRLSNIISFIWFSRYCPVQWNECVGFYTFICNEQCWCVVHMIQICRSNHTRFRKFVCILGDYPFILFRKINASWSKVYGVCRRGLEKLFVTLYCSSYPLHVKDFCCTVSPLTSFVGLSGQGNCERESIRCSEFIGLHDVFYVRWNIWAFKEQWYFVSECKCCVSIFTECPMLYARYDFLFPFTCVQSSNVHVLWWVRQSWLFLVLVVGTWWMRDHKLGHVWLWLEQCGSLCYVGRFAIALVDLMYPWKHVPYSWFSLGNLSVAMVWWLFKCPVSWLDQISPESKL